MLEPGMMVAGGSGFREVKKTPGQIVGSKPTLPGYYFVTTTLKP
jgi:hypothetical protein